MLWTCWLPFTFVRETNGTLNRESHCGGNPLASFGSSLVGVPVLMLTTESQQAMKDLARAAGATGWLVKPFNPEMLLRVIAKVVN